MSSSRSKDKPCELFLLMGFCTRGWRSPHAHIRQSLQLNMAQRKRELEAMEGFMKRHRHRQGKIKRVENEIKVDYAKAISLDLAIVMDCTGSMQPWITQAKLSILSIVDKVKNYHDDVAVRVGFVAYCGLCDGNKRLEVHQLTNNSDSVRQFIEKLQANGGGGIA